MALVQPTIADNLYNFLLSLQDPATVTDEDKTKIRAYANGLTTWLIASVTSATVTVAPGIAVTTAGSPTAQAGATVAPGTAVIS